jgi:hypothetical protein
MLCYTTSYMKGQFALANLDDHLHGIAKEDLAGNILNLGARYGGQRCECKKSRCVWDWGFGYVTSAYVWLTRNGNNRRPLSLVHIASESSTRPNFEK